MISTSKLCRCIGTVVLCLSLAGLCHAQAFVFGSPNTRTHMPDHVALASQDSFEQQNFLAVARYLAARLCPAPKVQAATGIDGPGAENSAMVTGCKSGPATYLGELLARYAHQNWALIFIPRKDNPASKSNRAGKDVPSQDGPERLFTITLSGVDPEQTLQQMRKHGLTDGTVVVQENHILVYVWVKDSSMDGNIHAFVEASHGEVQEIAGTGKLIGHQDRGQAQRILDENISRYERAHGVAFSGLLWSKKMRDMGLSRPETPSSPSRTIPTDHGVPSGRPSALSPDGSCAWPLRADRLPAPEQSFPVPRRAAWAR